MKKNKNMKRCYKCKRILDYSDFYKDSSRKNNLSNRCKKCDDKKTKLSSNPKSPKTRIRSYRWASKKRNYEFNLTEKQFMSFWGKNCYYCGDKIDGIGIDRVDNNLGYDLKNCVPCCSICNRMKMTQTIDEFLDKCEKIVKKHFK